jgi:hypothetical protein
MHRSGTSMITDLLEDLGLFMGRDQGPNQEAMFFFRINSWLLRQSGGEWDHPTPIDLMLNDDQVRPLVLDYIRFLMRSPRAATFMGWKNYLRVRNVERLPMPWGWKDPRNTFTLPLWLDLFPNAKIIHIYRNGVDVANSLRTRGKKRLSTLSRWKRMDRRIAYSVIPRLFPVFLARHMTLDTGFRLWELYSRRADTHIAALPQDRTRTLKYEDFLQNPSPILRGLCEFASLDVDDAHIVQMCSKVNPTRAHAYQSAQELMRFYETVRSSAQMVHYSYDQQEL